jgi:hypothetical protein
MGDDNDRARTDNRRPVRVSLPFSAASRCDREKTKVPGRISPERLHQYCYRHDEDSQEATVGLTEHTTGKPAGPGSDGSPECGLRETRRQEARKRRKSLPPKDLRRTPVQNRRGRDSNPRDRCDPV